MKTTPYLYTGSGSAIDDYNKPKSELQNIVQGGRSAKNNWGAFDKKNKLHLTILSQLRTLQWTTKSQKWGEVADINRLSDFLKSDKSPVNKPLTDMTQQELSKIISCFDSIITKHFK
ncbi:MAG: hypothetical protein REI96_06190 [Flavobacterium nitrogenifigens]|uniref:hypothetical protein n=1 Tax=Flavobacterium nitrogenifigens TaxID=1617283 RepID=UPI0028088017|nr:hypothetical protein [Flavobacterium nitrogenifigens]MDQ8012016.1 hypothetical protein [Flavobacterium nitrogenifigens]